MKMWLTLRVEDGEVVATAHAQEPFTDSEDNKHLPVADVEVELTKEVEDRLKKALKDAEADLKKAMTRSAAVNRLAAEQLIEKRSLVSRAAGAAKKVFAGRAEAKGTTRRG